MVLLEVFTYLRLSLIVDPCVTEHLGIFFEYFLIIHTVGDDIEYSIAKIEETAYDDQLEGMLTYLVFQYFLLVCPIEDQAGSILEMQFFIVNAVELEEQVY